LLLLTIVANLTLLGVSAVPTLAADNCPCSGEKAAKATAATTKFEQDRKAILAMAGEYRVTFQFQETVATEPGYELRQPYHAQATEFVQVIEDRGGFISLQHILMLAPGEDDGTDSPESPNSKSDHPRVIKHWRQDWTYQDAHVLNYRGNRTWENVTLPSEQVEGTWSQAVFQVDDSPRYESIGKWIHEGNRSAWESGETWRPLPRREITKRRDYGVLVARNRHTLTPAGWVHEQDNRKLVIDEQGNPIKVLAHESGLNVYDRADNVDFAAGKAYWKDTAAYWQDIRAIWADLLDDAPRVTVLARKNDALLHNRLFDLADRVRQTGSYDAAAVLPQARAIIADHATAVQ
jgi:hypothetical protein